MQIFANMLYKLHIYIERLGPIYLQTTENKKCVHNLIVSKQKTNEFTEKFNLKSNIKKQTPYKPSMTKT